MQQKLQDQVAVVTGASSGIGAGCAIELANAGATVVVNYPIPQGKEMAEKVVAEIAADGGKAIFYKADVSREDEVQQMFSDVIGQFGTLDILVNNAGLQKDAPFTEMTLTQWNFVLAVNLTGQFLCAREAIREFLPGCKWKIKKCRENYLHEQRSRSNSMGGACQLCSE